MHLSILTSLRESVQVRLTEQDGVDEVVVDKVADEGVANTERGAS